MGRDSNSRSPVCETGIITRLDYPSIFFEELTCPPFSCNARLRISIYFLVSVLFAFSLLSNSIQASRGLGGRLCTLVKALQVFLLILRQLVDIYSHGMEALLLL